MNQLFNGANALFTICAGIGAGLFLYQVFLLIVGQDGLVDCECVSEGLPDDTDISFTFLNIQTVTSFIMMFGMSGLVYRLTFSWRLHYAVPLALITGAICMYLIFKLYQQLLNLQSNGIISLENAVGKEGTVYLRIPEDGVGKVTINLQGRLVECEAVSHDHSEISYGQPIKVREVHQQRLHVEKV